MDDYPKHDTMIAKLVNIVPISLWFMILTTILFIGLMKTI